MAKIGDKIDIEIKRDKPSRSKNQPARKKRHGPEPRIPDDRPSSVTPNIILIDAATEWLDFSDDFRLIGNAHRFPAGVMAYIPRLMQATFPLDEAAIAALADNYRSSFFSRDSVKLPPFTGTEYRKILRAMPIPRVAAEALNLTVKLNARAIPFNLANTKVATPAQVRLEAAIAANPQDAALIAKLEKEVHESAFPTATSICRENIDPQMWFTHAERDQRVLWREGAIFKPRLTAGGYKLAIEDSFHFEPFDLFDTDNFKITKRLAAESTPSTFDSEEVAAPRIKVSASSKQTLVYLVPKLWKFELNWIRQLTDQWDDNLGLPNSVVQVPWSTPRSLTGYLSAFSSPLVLTGWETPINASSFFFTNHPAYLHAYGDTAWLRDDTSDDAFLRFMMQLSMNLSGVGSEIIPQDPSTPQPPQANAQPYHYVRTDLTAQSDATIAITQEGAPVGMLVGGIETADDDGARYRVWRKTARVVETDTIYSGPYDDPGYNNDFAGFTFLPPNCVTKLHSATWTGTYPANRWTWASGGLCASDSLWPYLMLPRWSVI